MANPVNFRKRPQVPTIWESNSVYFINNDIEGIREIWLTDANKNPARYSRDFQQTGFLSYMTDAQAVGTTYGVPGYQSPSYSRGLVSFNTATGVFGFNDNLAGELFTVKASTLLEPGTITNRVTGFIQLLMKPSGGSWGAILTQKYYSVRGVGNTTGGALLDFVYPISAGSEYAIYIKVDKGTSSDSVLIDGGGSFLSVNVLKS